MLDTNVLVSALLSPRGTPAQLLRSWLDGAFDLVVSPALLDELGRVLAYPKVLSRITERERAAFLAILAEHASQVDDANDAPTVGSDDPDDDYLIAVAESGRAVLVSGDQHLLRLAEVLPVYSPAEFLSLLR